MTSQLRQFESALVGGNAADIKPHLLRLSSQLKDRLGYNDSCSLAYVKRAARLLSTSKRDIFSSVRFETLREAVPYLCAHGALTDALIAAECMRHLAEAPGSRDSLRQAQTYIGAVYAGLGNAAEAIIHFDQALKLARHADDRAAESGAFMNIGSTIANIGLWREGIGYMALGARLENSGSRRPEMLSQNWANMADALYNLGEINRSYEAIMKALETVPRPEHAHATYARTCMELNAVKIALRAGKVPEARQHAEACKRYAFAIDGPSACIAMMADGLFNVYAGTCEYGLQQLKRASEQCAVLQRVAHRVDVLVILVDAYEQCEQPEEALTALQQALRELHNRRRSAAATLFTIAPLDAVRDAAADLSEWRLREAQLRAAVAERRTAISVLDMLERLAVTASLREDPSGQHGYRVGRLSALVAGELGWGRKDCHLLDVAARLHDIGKVGIPDSILLTSQSLLEEERRFLRQHTTMGAELLSKSDAAELTVASEIARSHHEWWDGSGYPHRASGNQIPIHARIVALADVFDALTHGRPYAAAWTIDQALNEIEQLSGKQFDPTLAAVFSRLVRGLCRDHPDLDEYLTRANSTSPFVAARRNVQKILDDMTH